MLLLAWVLAGTPGLDKVHVPDALQDSIRRVAFQLRQNELFSAWEKAGRTVQTLTVEFDLKEYDPTFRQVKHSRGRFVLRRTPRGVLARCELSPCERGQESSVALLREDKLYLLEPSNQIARRLDLAGLDIRRLLERYFNPFVLLLDREQAQKEWRWDFARGDTWYTYLDVKPRRRSRGWFSGATFLVGGGVIHGWDFECARIVVMNKGSDRIPRHMPRQLWIRNPTTELTCDIIRWIMDSGEPPSDKAFTEPEKMKGWEVVDLNKVWKELTGGKDRKE
jgi:hypothetical protein